MKTILTTATLLLLVFSCKKDEKKECDTYLAIGSAVTDRTTTVAAGITSTVDAYGGDLCFSYTGMEISKQSSPSGPVFAFEYFIKAKAKRPCGKSICAQAIYHARDIINIKPGTPGTYYLNFYGNGQIVQRDTVIVN